MQHFHIPIVLQDILLDTMQDMDSFTIENTDNSWAISSEDHLIGWMTMEPVNSYLEIEILPAISSHVESLNGFFEILRARLSEAVGSDQCKTGRCTTDAR